MDIIELGAIGELVGGVAVLVTLAYLATQVRQNTSVIRASASQSFLDSINQVCETVAGDVEQARVWRLAMEDPGALTEDERYSADWMCLMAFHSFENAMIQHEMGSLDRQTTAMIQNRIRKALTIPYYQEWWERNDWGFTDRLVQFVEECESELSADAEGKGKA